MGASFQHRFSTMPPTPAAAAVATPATAAATTTTTKTTTTKITMTTTTHCTLKVDSSLQGYNATIFAYGQTGTGKVRDDTRGPPRPT